MINDSDRPRLHMTVIADVNDDVLIRSYEVHKSKRNQRYRLYTWAFVAFFAIMGLITHL